MFETVSFETTVGDDGHLRMDVPIDLPPGRSVRVTVAENPKLFFSSREEWEAHARQVVGSIPDIERPEQGEPDEIEPL